MDDLIKMLRYSDKYECRRGASSEQGGVKIKKDRLGLKTTEPGRVGLQLGRFLDRYIRVVNPNFLSFLKCLSLSLSLFLTGPLSSSLKLSSLSVLSTCLLRLKKGAVGGGSAVADHLRWRRRR
jgi:hypothetical protein